jgi:hypothetical protein
MGDALLKGVPEEGPQPPQDTIKMAKHDKFERHGRPKKSVENKTNRGFTSY